MTLTQQKVKDLTEIEAENDYPTFVYQPDGQTYPCKGSITDFAKTLDDGGFVVERSLSLTVRMYNFSQASDGTVTLTPIFQNGIPKPQKKLTYLGEIYRIITVKPGTAYFRIMAAGPTRGL